MYTFFLNLELLFLLMFFPFDLKAFITLLYSLLSDLKEKNDKRKLLVNLYEQKELAIIFFPIGLIRGTSKLKYVECPVPGTHNVLQQSLSLSTIHSFK